MSIMELGALGEFLGVFALVATLVYLAIQVREAQRQSRQAAMETRTSGFRDLMIATGTSDRLSTAFQKASEALGARSTPFEMELTSLGLDPQEALSLRNWWVARYRLDATEFQGIGRSDEENRGRLASTYGEGIGRLFWDAGPGRRQSPFIDHVNELLADENVSGWNEASTREAQQ